MSLIKSHSTKQCWLIRARGFVFLTGWVHLAHCLARLSSPDHSCLIPFGLSFLWPQPFGYGYSDVSCLSFSLLLIPLIQCWSIQQPTLFCMDLFLVCQNFCWLSFRPVFIAGTRHVRHNYIIKHRAISRKWTWNRVILKVFMFWGRSFSPKFHVSLHYTSCFVINMHIYGKQVLSIYLVVFRSRSFNIKCPETQRSM